MIKFVFQFIVLDKVIILIYIKYIIK